MLPFESLTGATATGPGASKDLEAVLADHSVVVVATGSPATLNVALEGSLDDVTWVSLATASGASPTSASASGRPFRYVRANLTVLAGGSSPTVTATVASA